MSGNIVANSYFSIAFIKAKSVEILEKECLKNNLRDSRVYHYRDIQFVEGFWYAFYDKDQKSMVEIKRVSK